MDESWIVGVDWLASHRSPTVVPVDVRDDWEFDSIGHIPCARSIPFDSFRDEDTATPGMLPDSTAFQEALSRAGISPDDTLVAYDDGLCVFAARFVVTARMLGHEDARLLGGDYTAWSREHETTTDPTEHAQTEYQDVSSAGETSRLIDHEAVEAALDGDAVIVDTREPDEYASGHLPGAVRFDWRELMDTERRQFRPAEEARRILADAGITPDQHVVLYCNTARRISHTYVALRALGYDDVAFYEGSLTEWREIDGRIVTDEQ